MYVCILACMHLYLYINTSGYLFEIMLNVIQKATDKEWMKCQSNNDNDDDSQVSMNYATPTTDTSKNNQEKNKTQNNSPR